MDVQPANCTTLDWIKAKFAKNEQVVAANTAAFKAGHAFGETAELSAQQVEIKPAKLEPGTYTNIDGNTARLLYTSDAADDLLRVDIAGSTILPQ